MLLHGSTTFGKGRVIALGGVLIKSAIRLVEASAVALVLTTLGIILQLSKFCR
jgi:hypothetical protein